MFFVFRLCARGAAKNVYTYGRKWTCMGAIYWLDGRRGARGVVTNRGMREKSESKRAVQSTSFSGRCRSPSRHHFHGARAVGWRSRREAATATSR
jgi:hypothetical protein